MGWVDDMVAEKDRLKAELEKSERKLALVQTQLTAILGQWQDDPSALRPRRDNSAEYWR